MSADTTERSSSHTAVTPTSSRRGLQFALATAVISGVAVYVNGQAVARFDSPTVYTTGKNLVAGMLLVALAAGGAAGRHRTGRATSHSAGGLGARASSS